MRCGRRRQFWACADKDGEYDAKRGKGAPHFEQVAPNDTGRRIVSKPKSMVCAFVGLVGTLVLIGCATVTPQQAIQNNEMCLTVVVNSDPPGAKIYGGGESPGTMIGTTPLEVKYTRQLGL